MTTSLTALVAREHAADLWRAAQSYSFEQLRQADSPRIVSLRLAEAGDAPALMRLAELDEAQELSGQALLALIDGEVVAAMSLEDGRVVSNPFVAASDAVSLLELRAAPPRRASMAATPSTLGPALCVSEP